MGQALGRSINRFEIGRSRAYCSRSRHTRGGFWALIRVCEEPDWPCSSAGSSYKLLHSETIRLKPKVSPIECLGLIHQAVANLIDLWKPRHLSCEETIYAQNFKTAQIMGAARGAALSAPPYGRFRSSNTLLCGSSRLSLVLAGQARNKWPRLLPKCSACPRLFLSTSPMVWGWLFVMPSPGNPRKRDLVGGSGLWRML